MLPIAAPNTCPGPPTEDPLPPEELPLEGGSAPTGSSIGCGFPPPGGGIILGQHCCLKNELLIFSFPIVITLIISPVAINTAPLLLLAVLLPVFKFCNTLFSMSAKLLLM